MVSSRGKVSTMAGRRGSMWDRGAGMASQEEWAGYISQCAWTTPEGGASERHSHKAKAFLWVSSNAVEME